MFSLLLIAASWIAYPGDYALWNGNDLQARRIERGGGYPVFWASYAPHPLVDFKVDVDLKEEEVSDISWVGTCRLMADLDKAPWAISLPGVISNKFVFPAGKYHLTARVYSQGKPPALRINGRTLKTSSDWRVDWRLGASGADGTPAVRAEELVERKAFERRHSEPVSVKTIRGNHLFADFGRETFGFVRLAGISGKGRVRIIYGESEPEALCECTEEHGGPDAWEIAEIGDGAEWTNSVARGFRYLHVIPEAGISVAAVSMDEELCPLKRVGTFRCSDELLNRIWEVSARTLELTTRELFIEGVKRDRWTWSGDARQSYLMSYYLFGDQHTCRDTLFYQRGGDPVVMHLNNIPDYTHYWFLSVWEYYLYTGDRVFLEQIYDRMVSLMDFAIGRLDANGRPANGYRDWVFIDWAPERLRNYGGVCSFEQMLFVEALKVLADVSDTIGRKSKEDYRARAEKLRSEVVKLWWNEEKGGLMHLLKNDGTLDGQFTRYPNMFGLSWGYFDAAKRDRVLKDVIFNDSVMKITTPYMRFYELEALLKLGRHKQVLKDVKDYWGGMLNEGATSFWETYDPKEKGPEKYTFPRDRRPYRKSLCHAWGANPIYLIGRYYLGVEPVEPGFRKYVVRPNAAGLEWMEGTVPTPTGTIRVSVRDGKVSVIGCPGCEGEIIHPDGSRERVPQSEPDVKGVLCLTFDDRGYDGWLKAIPLFAKYNAHATFFAVGPIGTNEIEAIKALRAAGHTVGLHTLDHANAPEFFKSKGAEAYLREQLEPQLKACAAAGFTPRFMAYPNNRHSPDTDDFLSKKFARFRAGAKIGWRDGYYAEQRTKSIADYDAAFFPVAELPSHRVMEGVGVGEYYFADIDDICRGIRRAAKRHEVFTIFSHNIEPDAKHVSMKTPWLERILAEAVSCGVDIKGFDELGPCR